MKFIIRFANHDGYMAMCGMNNLIVLEGSIPRLKGRIDKLVRKYQPGRLNRPYKVWKMVGFNDQYLFEGIVSDK